MSGRVKVNSSIINNNETPFGAKQQHKFEVVYPERPRKEIAKSPTTHNYNNKYKCFTSSQTSSNKKAQL